MNGNKFTYYHGTSSIFLDSILKTGLGGINPNLEYKNLELLEYLHIKAEEILANDKDYISMRSNNNRDGKSVPSRISD